MRDQQISNHRGTPLLSLRGISKRFGSVQANREISIDVYPGEILGLLGENGAGKSTLMSILSGDYAPDSGEIWWKGEPVIIRNPRDAVHLGIGMVHQHFTLIPELTVVENIVLGLKSPRGLFNDLEAANQKIRDLSARYGLQVNPKERVHKLPLGVRQRVEILKVLYRGSQLLVLDEPTAVLTPQETDQLIEMLKEMAADGKTVVFVSHKFREVRAVCQRVVVLRAGQVMGSLELSSMDDQELANLVIGERVNIAHGERAPAGQTQADLCQVVDLAARDELGREVFSEVKFAVHKGEIVGVAGIAGNGQSELVECLAGLRPAVRGHIYLEELDITQLSPRRRRALGVAHIPEDRRRVGCVLDFNLEENIILGEHYRPPVAWHGILNPGVIHKIAHAHMQAYNVKAAQSTIQTRTLSGGNLQKLVLARELRDSARLILAAEPTRGLDVAAVEFTYQQFLNLCSQGKGLLLFSSDLDEILRLSDRIFVMFHGRLIGPFPRWIGRKEIGYTLLTGETAGGGQ